MCIAAALVAAIAMTLLITWWRTPIVHLNGRMESSVFDFEGTVAAGYVLFALGLALAVGAVWRRTVPALIVAFIGYVAARVFVDTWLRQRFQAPLSETWSRSAGGGAPPAGLRHAWVLEQYPSDRLGRHVEIMLGPCARPAEGAARAIDKACFLQHAPGYLPRDLPAREPLLALPGDRDLALRRRSHPAHRVRRLVDAPTRHVNLGAS